MGVRVSQHGASEGAVPDLSSATLTDWDYTTYRSLVFSQLTDEQQTRIAEPTDVFPRQESVLAVHWHPEFVPMPVIEQRIDRMFPNRTTQLIIPTQHNRLMSYGPYSGVEVDCYSGGFNRKVQLLLHFESTRLERADVLRGMLAHTFRYRARQLFEFWDTVTEPAYEGRLHEAAAAVGADDSLIAFTRQQTDKMRRLFAELEGETPEEAIRNKLLTNYFDALRPHCPEILLRRAITLLKAVKAVVKANFSIEFFYATEEIIEETRSLGGGIVIPHPEQFWPILLADYDVDGYEVWNPQSREYSEFLIHVVKRVNRDRSTGSPLLIFMGDDCHMGEKVKDPAYQDPEKAGREIGLQPAWDDLSIRKTLIAAGADRHDLIENYKARLGG